MQPCVYLNQKVRGAVPRLVAGEVVEYPRVVMGNLADDDLAAIWRSAPYRAFRRVFSRRAAAYAKHMQGISPELEGLSRLERAVEQLEALFATELAPPAVCRNCPHLDGF